MGSSSQTRNRTWAPVLGVEVLATGPPGKSLNLLSNNCLLDPLKGSAVPKTDSFSRTCLPRPQRKPPEGFSSRHGAEAPLGFGGCGRKKRAFIHSGRLVLRTKNRTVRKKNWLFIFTNDSMRERGKYTVATKFAKYYGRENTVLRKDLGGMSNQDVEWQGNVPQ